MLSLTRSAWYTKRETRLDRLVQRCRASAGALSTARLLSFIAAAAVGGLLYAAGHRWLAGAAFVAGGGAFVIFVRTHDSVKRLLTLTARVRDINSVAQMSMRDKADHIADCGNEFIDKAHPYTTDLDVFGKGSLFQMINCAGASLGRKKLADSLSGRKLDQASLAAIHEAALELAPCVGFRQKLQAFAALSPGVATAPDELIAWAGSPQTSWLDSPAAKMVRFLPVLTIGSLVSVFLWHPLAVAPFATLLLAQFMLVAFSMRRINAAYDALSRACTGLGGYRNMLTLLEKRVYRSSYVQEMRQSLCDVKGTASARIDALERILIHFELRTSHLVYWPLNLFGLWDLQWYLALRAWRKRYGAKVESWLHAVGEFERLASLAYVAFNNPGWTFPVFTERETVFEAQNAGHPLIEEVERIGNDFAVANAGTAVIITGSNMSGKSTFLRTVGINLVLAHAGAPVCARFLHCSFMDIFTSMRIADSVQGKVSTFYAELLRIRDMIEQCRDHSTLYCIDEIFGGTNSRDRHEGAIAVLNILTRLPAIGLVSTHDLELCELAKRTPGRYKNYHFREHCAEGKIEFDYRLRKGPSTTTNALKMIELVGIRMDDEES